MQNIFPNVKPILPLKDEIPNGYRLMVYKWSFDESRIGESVEICGKRIKKMLTLDLNIPEAGFAAFQFAHAAGPALFCLHQSAGFPGLFAVRAKKR